MKEQYLAQLIADAKLEEVPLEKLKLDVSNVRFFHIPEQDKETEDDVEKLIREDPKTYELYDQILAAGTIFEPLVIDSNYRVIEGNRRLVCLRLLDRAAKEGKLEGVPSNKFSKVKCKILSEDVNKKTVDIFLANIHVRSKLPWRRFNRSKQIYRLATIHRMTYDEISETTGMSRPMIARDIKVYKQVQKYAAVYPDDKEWVRKFTYFEEVYKRKDLKEDVEKEGFLDRFSKWVHDGKFRDVRDVRKLKAILDNPEAEEEFEKHDMYAAETVLESQNPGMTDKNFKHIADIINFIKFSKENLEDIASNPAKMKLIVTLEAEAKNLLIDLEAKKKSLAKTKVIHEK